MSNSAYKIEASNYANGFIGYVKQDGKTFQVTSAEAAKRIAAEMQKECNAKTFYRAVDFTYGAAA